MIMKKVAVVFGEYHTNLLAYFVIISDTGSCLSLGCGLSLIYSRLIDRLLNAGQSPLWKSTGDQRDFIIRSKYKRGKAG